MPNAIKDVDAPLNTSPTQPEQVGRKLGSRVDRSISNGNFAESVIFFCLVSRNITDSAKFSHC